MTILRSTANWSILRASIEKSILFADEKGFRLPPARSLLALILAGLLTGGRTSPAFAQSPGQNPASNSVPAPSAGQGATTPATVTSLGLAKHDFTNGPRAFPDLIKPYLPIKVEDPVVTNSPRIDKLIHDGKLELSLQDAVELALENSLDIAVQRYDPWIADTAILKTKAGGVGGGTPGGLFNSSTASLPFFSYDPTVTSTVSIDSRFSPVNNPFISGTGAASLSNLHTHSTQFNNSFTRGFETGTNFTVSWNNTRSSSTSSANFFNPVVQSALTVGFSQQLLNGFGRFVNRRNIMIAKNNRHIADWAFAQQAITTITSIVTDYSELVYARENVQVQQQAVAVSEKLYNDNKKQLGAGTMAPLDVTRAESELATDRQNLIVAETVQLQDEQILKNAISKDPLAPNLIHVEILTTDLPTEPSTVENPSFEESMKEAFAKRPDLQEQAYNVANADIDVRATRNALLPTLTLSGQYSSAGLAGNSPLRGASKIVSSGVPIVDANGNPIAVDIAGVATPIFESANSSPTIGTNQEGFTTAQNQIFHNKFPDYLGQLTLNLPLRNRAAQADHARALLVQRQLETEVLQLRNAAILDVRNSYIALTQGRAQVEAARKARELQQQTFEAEQKKYRLGASTVYNVILTQRDLIAAQGTELRALANLEEAKASYERALGRTLEVHHVTIADAKTGEVERDTRIPGTLHGKVAGTEDLFRDRGRR